MLPEDAASGRGWQTPGKTFGSAIGPPPGWRHRAGFRYENGAGGGVRTLKSPEATADFKSSPLHGKARIQRHRAHDSYLKTGLTAKASGRRRHQWKAARLQKRLQFTPVLFDTRPPWAHNRGSRKEVLHEVLAGAGAGALRIGRCMRN
jgi:hypothetical protein